MHDLMFDAVMHVIVPYLSFRLITDPKYFL